MSSVEVWQATLALEHAAVYGYGLLGSHIEPGRTLALENLQRHRQRRNRCIVELQNLDVVPVAAEPAYRPSNPVSSSSAARALAAQIEQDCAVAYCNLAQEAGTTRQLAASWLRVSAIQQARWSGVVPPLPGLDDQPLP